MSEWARLLTGSNKSRVLSELKRRSVRRKPSSTMKEGAVLVPFILKEDNPELLFTVRSRSLRSHRGQVSFPGGVYDESDHSLIETALRETEEELGVERHRWDIWGDLPPIPGRGGAIMITPVIATIPDLSIERLDVQKSEVDFVFALPLSHLAGPSSRKYTKFKDIPVQFPVYLGGPRRIWGITGFIIDYVLTLLLPHKT
ncbi:PREDICTED: nucleoside diphosphate-linked moiety X motif 8-like [Amphimedon queenslandica]|nr:PREDICTED: nucleoside diphosphate-linked moiety X motif 8-like [Amphimedon queenslandica]|eukprot:XP_019863164.1 PREDICTED: nucleoside diphosphate-linked moiety X motif 8-like [Amphimedon queenslandica]